jgi:biotin carboxyl carrier protein
VAKYSLTLGDRQVEAELEETRNGDLRLRIDGEWRRLRLERLGDTPFYVLTVDGQSLNILAHETAGGFVVQIGGISYQIGTRRPVGRARRTAQTDQFESGKWTLISPIAGTVNDLKVGVGDIVEAGTVLMIVEAMKMQNDLRSRVAGRVSKIPVSNGQRVETGVVLLEIEEVSS